MKILLYVLLIPILFLKSVLDKNIISQTKKDTISAVTIINKSKKAYAQLPIYLDSGKVVESFYNMEHPHKTAKLFKTAYSKTGQFNFEYYVEGQSNSLFTINRTANVIKTWWGVTNKIETPTTINSALAAALGVSSRTSSIIPGLLLTTDFKNSFYDTITMPVIEGSELINGMDCYMINGLEKVRKSNVTVWIGKKDFLIRKIETDNKISVANNLSTIHKMDSLNEIKHKADPEWIKQEAVRKATNRQRDSIMQAHIKSPSFNVKDTYLYFPYVVKNLNQDIFKFRPNREVSL